MKLAHVGEKAAYISYIVSISLLAVFIACSDAWAISDPNPAGAASIGASIVTDQGVTRFPQFEIPFSPLASDASKRNLVEYVNKVRKFNSLKSRDITEYRKNWDDVLTRPSVDRLRSRFKVAIDHQEIAGVPVDIVSPAEGIPERNVDRVLINLHGGGFLITAGLGGQLESIPISAIGKFKVVSINYRQGPESHFPAASEDVASVYRELIKKYRPENIGIYGCSAGGWLTAESVAWFQVHALPKPGAIGLLDSGALINDGLAESNKIGAVLWGSRPPSKPYSNKDLPYLAVPGLSWKDPLVSPAYSSEVLAKFPPTLLVSGTRDILLSDTAFTHENLVQAGVDAELHVWEGSYHCSFAEGNVDPDEPETKDVWNVIVQFFNSRLHG